MNTQPNAITSSDGDVARERWQAEHRIKEREIAVKEQELAIKRAEQASSSWRNPLVIAILAAAIAAAGSALVALVNGKSQRDLETQKAEQKRILEMIKTGDPDRAADNLRFLLKAGLIDDPIRASKIRDALGNRAPGSGPALPAPTGSSVAESDDAGGYGVVVSGDKKDDLAIAQVKLLKAQNVVDTAVYDRQGFLRTVARFTNREGAALAQQDLLARSPGAYVVSLTKWCPTPSPERTLENVPVLKCP